MGSPYANGAKFLSGFAITSNSEFWQVGTLGVVDPPIPQLALGWPGPIRDPNISYTSSSPVKGVVEQSTSKISGALVNTTSGDLPELPSAGSTIVVAISIWNDSPSGRVDSVTDNQGNVYSKAKAQVGGSSGFCEASIWYAENIGTPSGTFTITVNPVTTSANYIEWVAVEVSGILASSSLDGTNGASSNGTIDTTTNATATLAQADEIAFIVASVSNNDANITIDTPAGFTRLAINQNASGTIGFEASYQRVYSAAALTATWSHDNNSASENAGVIATFKVDGSLSSVSFPPVDYTRLSFQHMMTR